MSITPVEQVCPHCGAPLDVDLRGACRWCQARIRVDRPGPPAPHIQDQVSLVPEGTDNLQTGTAFLRGILQMFEGVAQPPAVVECMRQDPRLLQQIQALTTAVSAAGVRVRDAGPPEQGGQTNLAMFTPEEIWTFDLAFDVLAQLCVIAALAGPLGQRWADMAHKVQNVHQRYLSKNGWQQGMTWAGDGPVAWHELRAQTPREIPVLNIQDTPVPQFQSRAETDEYGTPLYLYEEGRSILVPEENEYLGIDIPFVSLAVVTFQLLGQERAVKECMRREPRLLQQIRALTTAVGAAGVRGRDAGLLPANFRDGENLAAHTPEEIWTFDLAVDVLAQLSMLDGLSGHVRASIPNDVRLLGDMSRRSNWKKAMKKAGDGPATWRELRTRTPHRGWPR